MRALLVATIAALALSVTAAPAAEARWWPDNPFDHTRFARGCVKQKHLSFQLRVVARRIFGSKVCIPPMRVRITSAALGTGAVGNTCAGAERKTSDIRRQTSGPGPKPLASAV